MNPVYEYRRAPTKGVIWLSFLTFMVLVIFSVMTETTRLTWLLWALGSAMIFWMSLPKPVAGIRVDDDFLILSAWRNPRKIPLDDIAHLRATAVSAHSDIVIVYRDGREEGVFAGDMPDLGTLAEVMALRGIPVRDIY